MIIYRPHRGSVGDAMKHVQEFESEQEMKEAILEHWKWWPEQFAMEDVTIDKKARKEPETGWQDMRIVRLKQQIVGMCATDYK